MIKVINRRHGESGGIYVGRPSPLGNPYILNVDGSREEVISKYRTWLIAELFSNPDGQVAKEFNRLKDKYISEGYLKLVCWCAPLACHADVIKEGIEHESI